MHNKRDHQSQIDRWNHCLVLIGQTQNKQEFMRFYDHFAPRLNSWLLGVTQDSALAEELVQETMLVIWRKASQYNQHKAAASTWVFRIARNLHIDYLRRGQVRERSKFMLAEQEPSFDDQTTDSGRIRTEMKRLPVQQAQVLYKSYFEGKSHQEIADDMDLPLGSVKSSLRLAFQKLCSVLRP